MSEINLIHETDLIMIIHAPTQEDYNEIITQLIETGHIWKYTRTAKINEDYWDDYRSNTHIYVFKKDLIDVAGKPPDIKDIGVLSPEEFLMPNLKKILEEFR